MDLPQRIKQHKAQSDSFAILLYKLKDLGIFRNVTENDYGIDFEIEIVHNERLTGNYLKAQVKSAQNVKIRKDGTPYVSGIKQSTLWYWSQLSYRSHVVVFTVDLKTEQIFFTRDIFWQAISLLDKGKKSKSIKFLEGLDYPSIDDIKMKEQVENFLSTLMLKKITLKPSLDETIYAHKSCLRNIKLIFAQYQDIWHCDGWVELDSFDVFQTTLEISRTLLELSLPDDIEGLDDQDRRNIFSTDYWVERTGWSDMQISNDKAKIPMKIIMPYLLEEVQKYSNRVLNSSYYWINKDVSYLKLVHQTLIPAAREHEEILEYYHTFANSRDFQMYLFEQSC